MAHVRKVIESGGVMAVLLNAGVDLRDAFVVSKAVSSGEVSMAFVWESGIIAPKEMVALLAYARVPRSLQWHAAWHAISWVGNPGAPPGEEAGAERFQPWQGLADAVLSWSSDMWSMRGAAPPASMPVPNNRVLRHQVTAHAMRVGPSVRAFDLSLVRSMFGLLETCGVGACDCGEAHQAEFDALMARSIYSIVESMTLGAGLDIAKAPQGDEAEQAAQKALYGSCARQVSRLIASVVGWDVVLDGEVLSDAPGGAA